nr:putative ribonuclease h protein [Quercus suber]
MEKVEDLLDLNKGGWDIEKVRGTFLHHEAEVILGMPISPRLPEDSQSWAWTKNGAFSVRSAYGVALKILDESKQSREGGECSDNSKMRNLWKSIWELKCPNKIKHFMWRACKGILPTHHNLAKRKVTSSDACVLCGESENTGHTLWSCGFASDVWKTAGVVLPNEHCSQEEFVDIVWSLREARHRSSQYATGVHSMAAMINGEIGAVGHNVARSIKVMIGDERGEIDRCDDR